MKSTATQGCNSTVEKRCFPCSIEEKSPPKCYHTALQPAQGHPGNRTHESSYSSAYRRPAHLQLRSLRTVPRTLKLRPSGTEPRADSRQHLGDHCLPVRPDQQSTRLQPDPTQGRRDASSAPGTSSTPSTYTTCTTTAAPASSTTACPTLSSPGFSLCQSAHATDTCACTLPASPTRENRCH